jgi:polyisoprenoid-binding protein YceI
MKKISIIISASLFLFLTAFTTAKIVWKNDDPYSQLGFTVTHLGITDVSGTFNHFDVSVTSSKPDFSDAVFELTANVASLDTRVEARDNHLKSADFFDAEKFPTITFKSIFLEKVDNDKYKLTGNLTMHGVTKPVTMALQYNGTVENAMNKKQTAGFQLTGTLKRSDFGIGLNFAEPMISDEVRIKADGEFIR